MTDSALLAEPRNPASSPTAASGFDQLQELMRHGYVPDHRPVAGNEGLMLRHEFAPDLVLRPDGGVDVPLGQKLKLAPMSAAAPPPKRKRRWFRALLILVGLGLYTLLSIAIVAGVMESL